MNTVASEWLKNHLHIFFYKKAFIARTVMVTMSLAVLVYIFSPNVYMSRFSVLVRSSDLDTTRIIPDTGVYVQPETVNAGVMSSEQAILLSDQVLGEALERTREKYPGFSFSFIPYLTESFSGLSKLVRVIASFLPAADRNFESMDPLDVENLRKIIVATPVPGARTIDVEITFYDWAILTELQKNVLEAYLNSRGNLVSNPTGRSIYRSDSQRYELGWRKYLEEASLIRAENRLFDPPAQRSELVGQLVAMQKETDALKLWVQNLQHQIQRAKSSKDILGSRFSGLQSTQAFVQMEDEIARLEVAKAALLGEFTIKNPEVYSKQRSINMATARYRELLLNTLGNELVEANARIGAIAKINAELEERLKTLDYADNKLKKLDQEISLAQESYQTYSRKLREVELQNLLRKSSDTSIAVVRSNFVPTKPVWPNGLLIFPLAFLLASFFALIGAYLVFYFEDIVLQPADLHFVDVPVIGTLPDTSQR